MSRPRRMSLWQNEPGPKTPPDFHFRKYIRAIMLRPDQKSGSQVLYREFESLQHKYDTLMSECDGHELRGGPINEMLTFGGDKRLIWVDIDTRRWDVFEAWQRSPSFPFVRDSYRAIPSSSGKIHVYVVVDKVLAESQAWKYTEHLRSIAPREIAKDVDRVYGPCLPLPVYIPFAHTGEPVMPQELVRECKGVTHIDKGIVGETLFELWVKDRLLRGFIREALAPTATLTDQVVHALKTLGVDPLVIRSQFTNSDLSDDDLETLLVYLDRVMETGGRWNGHKEFNDLSAKTKGFMNDLIAALLDDDPPVTHLGSHWLPPSDPPTAWNPKGRTIHRYDIRPLKDRSGTELHTARDGIVSSPALISLGYLEWPAKDAGSDVFGDEITFYDEDFMDSLLPWYNDEEEHGVENELILQRRRAFFKRISAMFGQRGWRVYDTAGDMIAYDPKHWDLIRLGQLKGMKPSQRIFAVEGGGLGSDDMWLYPKSIVARRAARRGVEYLVAEKLYDSVGDFIRKFSKKVVDPTLQWPGYHLSAGNIIATLGVSPIDVGKYILGVDHVEEEYE